MKSEFWTAPNQITLLRLIFVPLLVIAILDRSYGWALALFVAAGVSDALDGFLARVLQQRTRLGEYLDPIADKLLLSTLFVMLSLTGSIPWRVTVLVFSRDIIILAVCSVVYAVTTLRDFRPTFIGKASTVAQIATVAVVLLYELTLSPLVWQLRVIGLWSVAIFTIFSGVHYVFLLGHRLRSLPNSNAAG